MTDTPRLQTGPLADAIKLHWHSFLDTFEPLRADLYRYCRQLCKTPWDAEDLSQDTLARAFALLGAAGTLPEHPRAWLFRVASNAWIDRVRRARELPLEPSHEPASAAVQPRATREAAGSLFVRLSPQERAALVLKEAFALGLDEIALILSTSVGAVKAALHRGRDKLSETDSEMESARLPVPGVLDAFCEAFNAHDLDRLTALLLDHASTEVVGATVQYSAKAARETVLTGMLFGSRILAEADKHTGIDARHIQQALPALPRMELRVHRGEPLLLSWYAHADGEAVRAITRVELDGDQVARVLNYFYTPDFLADVCSELGVPHRSQGYRYWRPGC